MPEDAVLHEADTFAFGSTRNEAGRLSCGERRGAQGCAQRLAVVAFDFAYSPTEGSPFIGKRLEFENVGYGGNALNPVVIHNYDEIR